MSPSPKEQAQTEQFAAIYRRNQLPVMRSVERQVCGCDYGGTSWTTRKEADEIAGLLGLREGVHLLDLGSGSGWPALYWAETTGCNTVLTDLPFDSLRLAARRVIDDGLGTSCCFALASGIELPFSDGAFDAISHSDVLCCLPDKFAVLRSCHQALRRDGRMVFPVISIALGLGEADYQRAVENGPPFIEADMDYPKLLQRTGWVIDQCWDVTENFAATYRRLMDAEAGEVKALLDLFGVAGLAERQAGQREKLRAIDDGLLCREIFSVRRG
ncbi:MAG: class I SAM-dependent methyltransferase [Alphaproteobacteria bacterium]|jgi:ubiquinone/menaquinone biosynthesis C-methylase UbiE|nr:hypothetical protein [Rhodospirillaceae bacterium]MDP6023259.1 class I SAM-dependent methyltransferase [Alphaproteobacteria bacterium]MDP6255740.1 class I SAM-dependent methyltransferase [Alphaproteobacteria bacterium]MDP7052921.1 class I SAM-dependent methyltransferase [Alphaproteobacteria bacterium]MDP7228727.1 class I SAM-dependent methyltransferase [Alphaproteobacteria bacterium]|tara:strand:+ start:247 stop:1062 length:816 start_codon:yes stop_codon:yes gene_type:complete